MIEFSYLYIPQRHYFMSTSWLCFCLFSEIPPLMGLDFSQGLSSSIIHVVRFVVSHLPLFTTVTRSSINSSIRDKGKFVSPLWILI